MKFANQDESIDLERERDRVFKEKYDSRRNELKTTFLILKPLKWIYLRFWAAKEAKKEMIRRGHLPQGHSIHTFDNFN
ncbi:hypothetical protein IEN85_10795 [Pelagicoccus sp. NFK12]|uniref:Uncharacterized protein n=1 Tax=Pelagicoccus enzymogenes TaxID=2773457 RepID=A0A927FA21_9BACT|nr:hypothetical protein [Pelagicoccus enzymogenes]MBD5779976.1 hypothetical protein [Pelagicoccus enzymogenes]